MLDVGSLVELDALAPHRSRNFGLDSKRPLYDQRFGHTGPPHINIERGQPTDEELAALVAALGGAAGGPSEPGSRERNLWGHSVDELRCPVFSWQRIRVAGPAKHLAPGLD